VGIFALPEICLKFINTSAHLSDLLAKVLIFCAKSNDFPTEGCLAIGLDRRILISAIRLSRETLLAQQMFASNESATNLTGLPSNYPWTYSNEALLCLKTFGVEYSYDRAEPLVYKKKNVNIVTIFIFFLWRNIYHADSQLAGRVR
jgi:hypothetical protein